MSATTTEPRPAAAAGVQVPAVRLQVGEWLLDRDGWRALVVLNLLNVTDAVLTALWISVGLAEEANPIVAWMGFPAKVAVVLVLSFALRQVRARAMLIPIGAIGAVCAYHVVGVLLLLAWSGHTL